MDWKNRLMRLKAEGNTYGEIADILNGEYPDETFTGDRVRGWWRRNGRRGHDGQRSSYEQKQDKTIVSDRIIEIAEGEEITPAGLLKAHNLDAGKWEVTSYRNNYWHSQVKGGVRLVMYQSRLNARPIETGISLETIRETFADLERKTPIVKVSYPHISTGSKMAEVNVADLHLGKLCWHGNTGENYDHKIARANFESIIERICESLTGMDLEYILFAWSNDYFNSDNEESTTTKGTSQDTDVRFEKLFKVGTDMMCWAIERLKQIAPVRTFRTPSNHDNVMSLAALIVLQAWFRNDHQVTVYDDVTPRKYILFGNSLTGYCHGDTEGKESKSKEKASRLASLMPLEARELWGKARFYEMHTGHLHSEQATNEINGVIVRRISSPTASDTWHTESGYIGSTRKAQTFIYDKQDGIVQVIHTPIRQVDRVLN